MDEDSGLQQELELLKAIYLEDLTVDNSDSDACRVRVQIYPATGDNAEEKYVCLTLEFNLTGEYPDEVPEMGIRNPRGLADDHVMKLRHDLCQLAEERAGMPMLYELIELGKESLTDSNVPHGQCVICLEVLELGELFTKTECYHYFHSACLLRYMDHCHEEMEREKEEIRQHKHMTLEKKDVVCPVCREPVKMDIALLREQAPATDSEIEVISISPDIRNLQSKMAALYAHQQAKGGIIDVEAERNKFLLPSDASGPDAESHPAPLHLFNQGQLPLNLTSAAHMRGKGRGRPHSGRSGERPARDRGDKGGPRNTYRKDNRHRERRHPGHHEKGREDKPRPESVSHQERTYRKDAEWQKPADEGGSDGYDREGNGPSHHHQQQHPTAACEDVPAKHQPQRRQRSRGGKHSSSGRDVPDLYEKGWREEQNGEVVDADLGQCTVSSDLNSGRHDQWRHQRLGPGPSNGNAPKSLSGTDARDQNRQGDHAGARREGRRWSGRGRGRNFHGSKPAAGATGEAKSKESHYYKTDKESARNHSFDDAPHGGDSNRQGDAPEGPSSDVEYNRYGGRSDMRNDRRKHNRHHPATGKLNHDSRSNHVNRDYDAREQGSSGNPQPPPGFSEPCRPPPGFALTADSRSRPRAPPGFDEGR